MAKKPTSRPYARCERPATPLDPKGRYDLRETSGYLRQSLAKTHVDIQRGLLEVIKDGARTYITGRSIAKRCQP